jgi:hypothetical protein
MEAASTVFPITANGGWIADNQQVEKLSVSYLIIFSSRDGEGAF